MTASTAEGWRLLERTLAAGVRPSAVLMSERAAARPSADETRVIDKLRSAGVPCVVAPDQVVHGLTGGRTFGDLLGIVSRPDIGLPALLAAAPRGGLLVGVDVLDPGNIGALTRTAHAFGAAGIVWVGGTDPRHPKALRASMGSCFCVPWTHAVASPLAVVRQLAAAGWRNVATVARGGGPLVGEITGPCAIWMGGEAHGLADDVVSACDEALRIVTAAGVDSLSVNAAAAVVLSRLRSPGDYR